MRLELIRENPAKYGAGKKRVSKEVFATDSNHETGEIHSELNIEYSWVEKEPNYIKVYYDETDLIDKDLGSLFKYLIAFMETLTYANHDIDYYRATIRASSAEKALVAQKCNVTVARVEQALTDLIKAEVFIPVHFNGERVRSTYFVNPFIVARGDWSDIKKLRKSFELADEKTPTATIIDSKLNRKTVISRSK